jgi:hypothetical protein
MMHCYPTAGDEMGLGKTVQGCALLRCYQDEWPALVVAPSSLRQQWADALNKVFWGGVTGSEVVEGSFGGHSETVTKCYCIFFLC